MIFKVIIALLILIVILLVCALAYMTAQRDKFLDLCAENVNYIGEVQTTLTELNTRHEALSTARGEWIDVAKFLYKIAWGATYDLRKEAEDAGVYNERFKLLEKNHEQTLEQEN
jgi:hypothetical protein